MMIPTLKALIFDLDGTLAETERDGHCVAFNKAFAKAGLDWRWDVALYGKLLAVTGGKERIRYYLEHYQPNFHPPALEHFIAELHREKTRFYAELMKGQGLPLRPGVLRLLKSARQKGLQLAIATTTTLENVTVLLDSTIGADAQTWFACIAAGDVVRAKKPASDIYFHCLEQLQVEPNQCLAFEDSAHGTQAALGAGIKTIVTVSDYTRHENFAGAALILDHLGEPDQPCKILQGSLHGFKYVNMDVLQRLHGQEGA